jgi:pilus assembly protein Flp/PilA
MSEQLLKLHLRFADLITTQEGQDLVEYALLVALVALAAIGGVHKVASAITSVFTNVSSSLASA